MSTAWPHVDMPGQTWPGRPRAHGCNFLTTPTLSRQSLTAAKFKQPLAHKIYCPFGCRPGAANGWRTANGWLLLGGQPLQALSGRQRISSAPILCESPQIQNLLGQLGDCANTGSICRQWLARVCDHLPFAPWLAGAFLQREFELVVLSCKGPAEQESARLEFGGRGMQENAFAPREFGRATACRSPIGCQHCRQPQANHIDKVTKMLPIGRPACMQSGG